MLVSRRHVRGGVDLLDHRANLALLDQRHNVRGKAPDRFRFFLDGTRTEDGSDNGGAFAQHKGEIDLGFRPGREADANQPAAWRERTEIGGEVCPAYEVENDIDPRFIR